MKIGVIYCISNNINSKLYIGRTLNPKKRFKEHLDNKSFCRAISSAINKYGKEVFDIVILETCHEELLNDRERHWIAALDSLVPNGYNLTIGGDTNPMDNSDVRAYQKKVSGEKTAEMNKSISRRKNSSERMREQNLQNWKDLEYRKKMSKVTSERNKKMARNTHIQH